MPARSTQPVTLRAGLVALGRESKRRECEGDGFRVSYLDWGLIMRLESRETTIVEPANAYSTVSPVNRTANGLKRSTVMLPLTIIGVDEGNDRVLEILRSELIITGEERPEITRATLKS